MCIIPLDSFCFPVYQLHSREGLQYGLMNLHHQAVLELHKWIIGKGGFDIGALAPLSSSKKVF